MEITADNLGRVLVLAAHPDDETIACSGLLQRATSSLVVFAVDGAPPRYGFEKQFGSLQKYSEMRFREATLALGAIPSCSFQRLARQDGTWFVDQHLFLELPEAFRSLCQIVREYSPDLVVSHAFEGGHIDHDACHILAVRIGKRIDVRTLEFPLYWQAEGGEDVFQQFRKSREDEIVLTLSEQELDVKRRMLAEYRTQQDLTAVFHPGTECFRPMIHCDGAKPAWPGYRYENRRKLLKAEEFSRRIAELEKSELVDTAGPINR